VLRELLLFLMGLGATFLAVCAMTALLAWRWLRRRNAVGRHKRAPVLWLWSPGRAARLHRRLIRVWYAAHHASGGSASLVPTATALEARAEILDAELAARAAGGGARGRNALADVYVRVIELETMTGRLARTSRRLDSLVPRISEDPLAERLDALDAAVAELSPPRLPIARR
jgi:hypothetical protein